MSQHVSCMFDNTRFFHAKSKSTRESGWRGWVEITCRGERRSLPHIDANRSALVIIDMQRECCVEWPTAIGEYDEELAQVFQRRMEQIVIPNTQRLLKLFREKDLLVIYLTLDVDGIISQIAPNPERLGHSNWWEREAREFVLAKYSSGAFATSALDNVLRENDIATVFFVGVDTCGCVDATITEAYDRCYQTILIDDACCSSRPELHDAVVKIWTYKGFVRSSDQVIREYPWNGWVEAK